jgi:hypothetical protein
MDSSSPPKPLILSGWDQSGRIKAGKQRKQLIKKYNLDVRKVITPADMPARIYREDTHGIYWCYWNEWNLLVNNMWILTSNHYFVCVRKVTRCRGVVRVLTFSYGSYSNEVKHYREEGKLDCIPPFNIMMPKYASHEGVAPLGRNDKLEDTGYRRAVKDMALLIAYGCPLEDAFRISFRGNRKALGVDHVEKIALKSVLGRPDLVEELKVQLRKAFEEKGIDKDWLLDQLKLIGENQSHKEQFNVLMMIARVLNISLDNFSGQFNNSSLGGNVMGYASHQELGDGSTKSESLMIGPPDSVKAALGRDRDNE